MAKPESCRYQKSHEWVSLDGGTAVVGLSDHAQKEITDVVFVELPQVGRALKAGDPCGVVESVKAAFDIYAPVSGEVAEVNEKVAADPSLVNRSPHEEGWLFKLKGVSADEVAKLMDFAQYQEFLKTAGDASH